MAYNSPGAWHKLMALLLQPFMHENQQQQKQKQKRKCPRKAKLVNLLAIKINMLMGKTLLPVCVSLCVCVLVCVLKHKSFCQQWPTALTCDDEQQQQRSQSQRQPQRHSARTNRMRMKSIHSRQWRRRLH